MNDKPFSDMSYQQFLSEGKIMGSKCKKCGTLSLPPRPICISCFGSEMSWAQFNGAGKLAAFTCIAVAPPHMAREGFGRNNPYVVGVVELDEGVKTVARIIGVDANNPEQIKVGMSLKAEFFGRGEEPDRHTSLVFRKVLPRS